MIKKLQIRFIVLAMVSLTVLLAVIVAGMNIINYREVVSDADTRIEVLEENRAWFEKRPEMMGDDDRSVKNGAPDPDNIDDFFGRRGPGGPSMTRDEAEESRFFTVSVSSDGEVEQVNVARIAAVDSDEAADYAGKVLESGEEKGFVGEFRYSISSDSSRKTITFLDCGRVLDSWRDFLRASVLMSLAGLLIVFVIICYFSGRIVRPVAESYDKQKRFVTDAGHEIKTPLAIIKANLDLMDMELDSVENVSGRSAETDELRESLGDIDDQVDRLTGLTNDLVYLSRMEEAGNTMIMTDVPLSDVVNESVSSFVPLARERGKALIKDVEPAVSVRGSTGELEKLMSILLENAIKYSLEPRRIELGKDECGMPAPPEIRVELRRDGRNALIEVANETETELTNESLAHVFDRFYRTDGSRNSATGGHGIGLSMAQAIVNAHSGKISARTTDGHDFIITATIPLA